MSAKEILELTVGASICIALIVALFALIKNLVLTWDAPFPDDPEE